MTPSSDLGLVCLAALVVTAGCLAGGGVGTPTQQPPGSPEGGECAAWVSFYGMSGPAQRTWAPDRVSIGYTVPADASVFFVVTEAGQVLGSTHVSTEGQDYGVTADGDGIPLEDPLNGTHELRVTAYTDVDGDERFDPETDAPCRYEGELVRTDARRIDFSRFRSVTPSPSPSPGD